MILEAQDGFLTEARNSQSAPAQISIDLLFLPAVIRGSCVRHPGFFGQAQANPAWMAPTKFNDDFSGVVGRAILPEKDFHRDARALR